MRAQPFELPPLLPEEELETARAGNVQVSEPLPLRFMPQPVTAELDAMRVCAEQFDDLSDETRARVLGWLDRRYRMSHFMPPPNPCR